MIKNFLIYFTLLWIGFQVVEAQIVTNLLISGGTGSKKDLVIIGDGFQAGADQIVFNNFVTTTIMQGMFGNGPLREDMNAFNIYRINMISTDSGVTQVDAAGNVVTSKNTALGYRYSGNWNRCWMEGGISTSSGLRFLIDSLVPGRDYVIVILNEANRGACTRGREFAMTTGGTWPTAAHEAGHLFGNLCDEYFGGMAAYTGGEPGCANLTRAC